MRHDNGFPRFELVPYDTLVTVWQRFSKLLLDTSKLLESNRKNESFFFKFVKKKKSFVQNHFQNSSQGISAEKILLARVDLLAN